MPPSTTTLTTTLIVATTPPPLLGIGKNLTLPWPRLPSEMSYFSRVTKRSPLNTHNAVIMGRKTWDSIPANFRPLPSRINIVISQTARDNTAVMNALAAASSPSSSSSWKVKGESYNQSQEELQQKQKSFDPTTQELWSTSLSSSISLLSTLSNTHDVPINKIFIIGGSTIYKEALNLSLGSPGFVDHILHTVVSEPEFDCDTFFPEGVLDEGGDWVKESVDDLVAFTGEERSKVEGVREEKGVKFEFGIWKR